MGAKTSMMVYSKTPFPQETLRTIPPLDYEQTHQWVTRLFPNDQLKQVENGSLLDTYPSDDEIYAGYFGDVFILAAAELAPDYPSQLDTRFIDLTLGNYIYLHAMHSVVDWVAFAVWENGYLQRSLSLSDDGGIFENKGKQLNFEQDYWEGKYPAIAPEDSSLDDDISFPFDPLELGEAALINLFGYELEGIPNSQTLFNPEDIELLTYKRKSKSWHTRF